MTQNYLKKMSLKLQNFSIKLVFTIKKKLCVINYNTYIIMFQINLVCNLRCIDLLHTEFDTKK